MSTKDPVTRLPESGTAGRCLQNLVSGKKDVKDNPFKSVDILLLKLNKAELKLEVGMIMYG